MPMKDAFSLLFAAVGIAWLTAFLLPATRRYLHDRRAWAAVAAGAAIFSAASWLLTEERMGGTLLWRQHGWPKTFSMECLSVECETTSSGFSLLYFVGNSFPYAATLLVLWTLVAAIRALLGGRRDA